MENRQALITEEGFEVPESALLKVERNRGYGNVPGLDDEEPAAAAELDRQVFLADWGLILMLPCRGQNGGIRPAVDEFGHLDWGAFGTRDFARIRGPFDKAKYKADGLQEKLRNERIMLDILRERLHPAAQRRVRELALHTEADLDEIEDYNEWRYAHRLRRAQELAREIHELRESSRQRQEREADRADKHIDRLMGRDPAGDEDSTITEVTTVGSPHDGRTDA